MGERVSVFARAGIVNAELEASVSGYGSAAESDTGAGYGVGGIIGLTDNLFLRGDYTRYDVEDLEADTFMISVGGRF